MTKTAVNNAVEKRPTRSRLLARWKLVVAIFVLLGIGSYLFYFGVVNVWDEFKLIYRGETTVGYITDTWEDVEPMDSGGLHWLYGGSYTYQLSDGREFAGTLEGDRLLKQELRSLTLTQPYPVEVKYLPDDPDVSRISPELPSSVLELIRSNLFPGFVSVFFWFIGFYLLWQLIRQEKMPPKVLYKTSSYPEN